MSPTMRLWSQKLTKSVHQVDVEIFDRVNENLDLLVVLEGKSNC